MKSDADSPDKHETRYYSIDLIKAICICLVLIWHLEPFDISIPGLTAYSINLIFKEAQIALYFQVTLIAVPAFLITSLYLYLQKLEEHGMPYFFKRMRLLFALTIFWIFCQSLFYYAVVVSKAPSDAAWLWPASARAWLNFLLAGGPSLPLVGDSVLYFLPTLIVLTVLSTLLSTARRCPWLQVSISGLAILGSLAYFEIQSLNGGVIWFSQLRNFALYTPIAYLVYKYGRRSGFLFAAALWAGYFLFSVHDILLRLAGMEFNIYGRVSIAFGAAALVLTLIKRTDLPELGAVKFLSRYSLGIFAMHRYLHYVVIVALMPVFLHFDIHKKISVGVLRVNFQVLTIGVLAALLTFIGVYLLSKSPLRRFVR